MILHMALKVFGQLVDAIGQPCDLHVRASSVFVMQRHAAHGFFGHKLESDKITPEPEEARAKFLPELLPP
jgi:hypothetical protein